MPNSQLEIVEEELLISFGHYVEFHVRIRIRVNFYTAVTAIIMRRYSCKKLLVALQDETSQS